MRFRHRGEPTNGAAGWKFFEICHRNPRLFSFVWCKILWELVQAFLRRMQTTLRSDNCEAYVWIWYKRGLWNCAGIENCVPIFDRGKICPRLPKNWIVTPLILYTVNPIIGVVFAVAFLYVFIVFDGARSRAIKKIWRRKGRKANRPIDYVSWETKADFPIFH